MPLPSAQNQTFFMLVLSALAKEPQACRRPEPEEGLLF